MAGGYGNRVLILRHCCYWMKLSREPTDNDSTKRIRIPRSNLLTPDAVLAILETERDRWGGVMNEIELQQARTVPLVNASTFPYAKRMATNLGHQTRHGCLQAWGRRCRGRNCPATTDNGGDTLRRITDALRTLSQIGDQDIATIAALIRAVAIDVLRSTVPKLWSATRLFIWMWRRVL